METPTNTAPKLPPTVPTKAVEKPTNSTPVKPVVKEEKEKAPSSGWSIGSKIAKYFNPEAVVCDPGEKMEAYYDEKLKRWIFPGDDPAEVAKPLAPPPVIPMNKNPVLSQTTPAKNNNDPLSSLMAPPAGRTPNHRIGQSSGGGGDPLKDLMAPPVARSHFSEPRVKAGASRAASMNIPASARKVPSASGSKPPAPHFVIFQPTAQKSNDKKSD